MLFLFCLCLFILSGFISSLFSSSILGNLPTWGVDISVSYLFAFSYCSCGSQGKNTEVICHSLLQWTTSCQNSPPWPIHLGWPYMAWLIVSLNKTRLWSMWSVWPQGCGQCDQFSVNVVFILSALCWRRIRGLWTLPDGRDWLWRKLHLFLMGRDMLNKPLIQFSVDGQGCVPSLFLSETKLWWR